MQVDYMEMARKVCDIIGVNVSDTHDLEVMLERLQEWTKNMVYCTSSERDVIDSVARIVQEIRKKEDKEDILREIEKLESDVHYVKYFD